MTAVIRMLRRALACLLAFAAILPGAAEEAQAAQPGGTEGKAQRIAVFSLHAEEILLDLVDKSRIVYVSHEDLADSNPALFPFCETKGIPGSTWANHDGEALQALHPDLLIVQEDLAPFEETFPWLKQEGTRVAAVRTPESMDDIRENIRIVGEAAGETAAAEQLLRGMDEALEALTAQYDGLWKENRPRVVYDEMFQESFSIICEWMHQDNYFRGEYDWVDRGY